MSDIDFFDSNSFDASSGEASTANDLSLAEYICLALLVI
jgi:hypothetical protein